MIPVYILFGIFGAFLNSEHGVVALSCVGIILTSAVGTIITVYYIEISAQFVRATLGDPKQVIKPKN